MPWGDGIERINCYSLSDFHDFDWCPFRFFVKHHLEKKYELEEGTPNLALGSLLDMSIKIFHKSKAYGQPAQYLENIVKAAKNLILEKVNSQKGPSFYSHVAPFLDDEMVLKATKIFQDYYQALGEKIKMSPKDVGFCERLIKSGEQALPAGRQVFKLWGGPDALEEGDDGMIEIVDYKFSENGNNFDMDLMPKIYTLLCAQQLLNLGYDKARFVVRMWQKPEEKSLYEEFDLTNLDNLDNLFKQKIDKIIAVVKIKFCEKPFCKACSSEQRKEYSSLLQKKYNLAA